MNRTDLCPLCGGPNECGATAGASTCWCFTESIPASVLDRIPEDQRNIACVCRSCASGADAASLPRPGATPDE